MKRRTLKYRINWQDTWDKMRRERIRSLKITYDKDFQTKFNEDFSNRYKWGDYKSGRTVVSILGEILNEDFEILEIGPGPGTLTIPLSEKVRKITCIEKSKENLEILRRNLNEKGIVNFELVNGNWGEAKIENSFDLVVCSHFLWQVEDIEAHLKKMEDASRGYCAVIQPAGRDELVKKSFEEICKKEYTGQFEADADYFPYVILREWSRLLDVRHLEYSFELDLDAGTRYIASYLGKFIEINKEVANKIKKLLMEEVGESWMVRDKAVVLWWKPDE